MKKLLAVLLCLAMVFTFAACGGSDGTSDGSGEAAESDVIKIGVILPFSGASQYVGQAQYYGYEYALADFLENYSDKIGGKEVQLITADSTGVPDTGVSEFERLVNEEGVCAVIGTYNSGVAASIAPLANKYGIPFMVTNAVADTILAEDGDYVYRTNVGDSGTIPAYLDFIDVLRNEGHTMDKVAVIYEESDYGQGARDTIVDNVFNVKNVEVVLDESFIANSGDLSTIVSKLKNSDADFAYVTMGENDALLFTRQMQEYGVSLPILAYGGGFLADAYTEQAGEACEYIMASSSYLYDPTILKDDALAITEKFISETEYPQMNEPFGNGWLGMYSLMDAIANVEGSTDSTAIANALKELKLDKDDRACLFHPIEGVEYADNTERGVYNQNKYASLSFGQIQGGAWRVVYPKTEDTADILWPEN